MNIFVANLSRDVTEDELSKLFTQFGLVKNVKIVKNSVKNESKGYGFVDMPDISEAREAISNLNTRELKGKRLTVNEGRSQKAAYGKIKNGIERYGSNSTRRF